MTGAAVKERAPATSEKGAERTLAEQVKDIMGDVLGVDEVKVAPDGDIPVCCDDVAVHVKILSDRPVVMVYSPALWDLGSPAGIHRVLNDINARSLFVKAVYVAGTVIFSVEVLGDPLIPEQLALAFDAVRTAANHGARELQVRYGGTTAFGETVAPKAVGVGGYL